MPDPIAPFPIEVKTARRGALERADLRARLRETLPDFERGLRVVAQGLPALQNEEIDGLAIDAEGRVVAILLALGPDEDALLLTRGVAIRTWLADQQPGWLQLVPELRDQTSPSVRCLLLAPDFRDVTRAAAEALLGLGLGLELVRYRPFEHAGDTFLLLEHHAGGSEDRAPAPHTRRSTDERDPEPLPTLRTSLAPEDFAERRLRQPDRSETGRPRFEPAANAPRDGGD